MNITIHHIFLPDAIVLHVSYDPAQNGKILSDISSFSKLGLLQKKKEII